jgi:deoxyinosine 3'endonuclease (endonuclease V)
MDSKPITSPHSWDLTPKEAIAVQKHLAGKIIPKSGFDIGDVAKVAGIDTHFYQDLKDGEETIGAVVRTRSKVKPLFVSIGHRINLQDSINIVLKCCSKYRLPETTRRADKLARGRSVGQSVIG